MAHKKRHKKSKNKQPIKYYKLATDFDQVYLTHFDILCIYVLINIDKHTNKKRNQNTNKN